MLDSPELGQIRCVCETDEEADAELAYKSAGLTARGHPEPLVECLMDMENSGRGTHRVVFLPLFHKLDSMSLEG